MKLLIQFWEYKDMLCCKKNRKFINDTVLLTKEQILHKFHKILCLGNWGFLMQKWCRGVAEDSSESLGLQGDQTSQSVNPKGNQSWIFIGRTDAEAKGPILWPPDAKNWLTGKDLMLGKIEGGSQKGMTGWDGWMASPTWWTWVWASSGSWWGTGKPGVHGVTKSRTRLSNWTELKGTKLNKRLPFHCQPSFNAWNLV